MILFTAVNIQLNSQSFHIIILWIFHRFYEGFIFFLTKRKQFRNVENAIKIFQYFYFSKASKLMQTIYSLLFKDKLSFLTNCFPCVFVCLFTTTKCLVLFAMMVLWFYFIYKRKQVEYGMDYKKKSLNITAYKHRRNRFGFVCNPITACHIQDC